MEISLLKNKYELKELELNSLLEVTQAINNNLPEDSLYKIYNFTLRANLNIKKLALYVLDDEWSCKVNYGTSLDYFKVKLDPRFSEFREIACIDPRWGDSDFNEFEIIIPVAHKNNILAFVFVGGLNTGSEKGDYENQTTFLQAISNIIIVAIENKKLARRQLRQEALRKELEIARNVQRFLFPKELPNKKGMELEASYEPHQRVGGDYYDYIPIDSDRFLFCIADVSGKGVPAALLMSNFQASLQTLVRKVSCLKEIVSELNYQTFKSANGENFITFFVAIYDRADKVLNYINAGHNPPLLLVNNEIQLLEKGTTILGSFKQLPFINEAFVPNIESFFFFGYTDGVIETINEKDEDFGMDRLKKLIYDYHQDDLKDLHTRVFDELNKFRGKAEFRDDITYLSCRVSPF